MGPGTPTPAGTHRPTRPQGNLVAIKHLNRKRIELTRKVLFELKHVGGAGEGRGSPQWGRAPHTPHCPPDARRPKRTPDALRWRLHRSPKHLHPDRVLPAWESAGAGGVPEPWGGSLSPGGDPWHSPPPHIGYVCPSPRGAAWDGGQRCALPASPGHPGEREHHPGLDVPLLPHSGHR